jgi:hypothetical protein
MAKSLLNMVSFRLLRSATAAKFVTVAIAVAQRVCLALAGALQP